MDKKRRCAGLEYTTKSEKIVALKCFNLSHVYVKTSANNAAAKTVIFKMSLLCNYMVASPNFIVEEIDHKFLVSGHSFLPCVQDFGVIEKEKNFHPHIFVRQDWHHVIYQYKKEKCV